MFDNAPPLKQLFQNIANGSHSRVHLTTFTVSGADLFEGQYLPAFINTDSEYIQPQI